MREGRMGEGHNEGRENQEFWFDVLHWRETPDGAFSADVRQTIWYRCLEFRIEVWGWDKNLGIISMQLVFIAPD